MAERIKLPFLTGFRIEGFEPIYSASVGLELNEGPYLVLGGNGLGKTTLMQAVVYGLAGGLDDQIEEVKSLRWNHGYFRGRLSPTQLNEAFVEVDFTLGEHAISVRRGFRGPNVVAVREGDNEWVEEAAVEVFGKLLGEYGGYLDSSDFSFVVHRLLYLPESRTLVAWDTNAQIRLLMLINQDLAVERDFRSNRAQLKKLDSKKRHIHVALGRAESDLEKLFEFEEEQVEEEEVVQEESDEELPSLVEKLNETGRMRVSAQRRRRDALLDLSRVSGNLDRLREEIETAEAGLVANFLAETEREKELALAKLVQSKICPACGQIHEQLSDRAKQFLRDHRCVLCGSDEPHESNPELENLRSELEEGMREQHAFEEVARLATAEGDELQNQELDIQSKVNDIRYSRSVVSMVGSDLPDRTVKELGKLKQKLKNEEADYAAQIVVIKAKLEADYDDFRIKMDARMDSLRSAYGGYATSFLGLPCELDEVGQNGLMELKLFVPRFGDSVRSQPESCSEAQRFFLDIAFRMALIDFASGAKGSGTFICETPETALDFSYVSNVVEMFTSFSAEKHNILLSANIQNSGIAEKLFAGIEPADREKRIVNLLDFGRLSSVQVNARKEFDKIVLRMLTSEMEKG